MTDEAEFRRTTRSRAQRIAGRPLGDMRAVVRLDDGAGFTLEEAREVFPRYDDAAVQQVLLDLVGAGLLVEDPVAHRWRCTPEGREIQRSSRKRLTRAKAEQILAHLVSRAHEVNANDRYVKRVETMVVFGSFLGDNPMIGDVDVAVELRPKFEDPREQDEAEKAARQRAPVARTFIDSLFWPKIEVMRTLKARSPVLELHDIDIVKSVLQRDPTTSFRVLLGTWEPPAPREPR